MKSISCGQRSHLTIYFLSAFFHIILALTTSGCIVSPYSDGCLVPDFSDEFDTFNISKWTHAVTMSGAGNGEFEMYEGVAKFKLVPVLTKFLTSDF